MKKTLIGLGILAFWSSGAFAVQLATWSAAGLTGGFVSHPVWSNSTVSAGIQSNATYVTLDASKTNSQYFAYSVYMTYQYENDTSQNTNKYIQVFITPAEGMAMTLTNFSFNVWSTAAGAKNVAVRSSLDNFTSNIMSAPLNLGANNAFDVTLTGVTNIATAVQFRIYLWNATGAQVSYLTNGSRPNAVEIDGFTSGAPVSPSLKLFVIQ